MKRHQLHPACKLFPKLGKAELQELADDIKANGLQNPIVLFEGKILDGRNRDAACKIAGVRPRFEKWKSKGSPVEWVISQNLMRRHLTASQRAVVALDLLPLLEKEAKQRQRLSNSYRKNGRLAQKCADRNGTGRASEVAARIIRSSSRYVEMVKAINADAPELVEMIRTGELNVSEANCLARLPKRKRASLLKQIEQGDNGSKTPHVRTLVGTNRKSLESYSTPPQATEALLERESFRGRILEPCGFDGAMGEVLDEYGHQVIASDIATGDDFLEMSDNLPNVITNPPFSLALEFVEHAKTVATSRIAMLLPLDFLHGVSRYELFQDRGFPLKVVYVFCQRLRFGNTPEAQSAPMANAWFVWDKRYKDKPTVEWIQ